MANVQALAREVNFQHGISFRQLKQAAEQNKWPPELTEVTDWELMSLEQEEEIVNLVYNHKTWSVLEKMLGCDFGFHCVEALLRRSSNAQDPHRWPEFAEKLFWTQAPSPFSRSDITLDATLLVRLLLALLSTHSMVERLWDYVPDTITMVSKVLPQYTPIFQKIVAKIYRGMMPIQVNSVQNLVRKWRIVYSLLSFSPPLGLDFLDRLHESEGTHDEARILVVEAFQYNDQFAMNVLKQLGNILTAIKSFIDNLVRQVRASVEHETMQLLMDVPP